MISDEEFAPIYDRLKAHEELNQQEMKTCIDKVKQLFDEKCRVECQQIFAEISTNMNNMARAHKPLASTIVQLGRLPWALYVSDHYSYNPWPDTWHRYTPPDEWSFVGLFNRHIDIDKYVRKTVHVKKMGKTELVERISVYETKDNKYYFSFETNADEATYHGHK